MRKNALLIAAGLALALVAGNASALSIFSQLYRFAIPASYGSGAPDTNAKWSPASRSVSETAAAKVAHTGIGLLDAVCATTATDEQAYVAIFNQSSVSGITATVASKDPLTREIGRAHV